MSANFNKDIEIMEHDPDVVDKLAWRSDIKVKLPVYHFSAARYGDFLLRSADTKIRVAETWFVSESSLLVAKFIIEAEGRDAALQQTVCATLEALTTVASIKPQEVGFQSFELNWLYTYREMGDAPENVMLDLPPVLDDEIPHHELMAA